MTSNATGSKSPSVVHPPPAPPHYAQLNPQNSHASFYPQAIQYQYGLPGNATIPAGYGYTDGTGSTAAYQSSLFQQAAYSLPHGSNNPEITFLLQANSTMLAKLQPDLQEVKKDVAVVKALYLNSSHSAIITTELQAIKTLIESLTREFYTFKDAYKEKNTSSRENSTSVSKRQRSPSNSSNHRERSSSRNSNYRERSSSRNRNHRRERSCSRHTDRQSMPRTSTSKKSSRNDFDGFNDRSKTPNQTDYSEQSRTPSRKNSISLHSASRASKSDQNGSLTSKGNRSKPHTPQEQNVASTEPSSNSSFAGTRLSSHLKITPITKNQSIFQTSTDSVGISNALKKYMPQGKLNQYGKSVAPANLLSHRLKITPFQQNQSNLGHFGSGNHTPSVINGGIQSSAHSSNANARNKSSDHSTQQSIYGPNAQSLRLSISESTALKASGKNRSMSRSSSFDMGHREYNPDTPSSSEPKSLTFNQYNESGESTAYNLSLSDEILSKTPKSPRNGGKLANSSYLNQSPMPHTQTSQSRSLLLQIPSNRQLQSGMLHRQQQNTYGQEQSPPVNGAQSENSNLELPPGAPSLPRFPPFQHPPTNHNLGSQATENHAFEPPVPPSPWKSPKSNLLSTSAPSNNGRNLLLQLPPAPKSNRNTSKGKNMVPMKDNEMQRTDDGVVSPDDDQITRPLQTMQLRPLETEPLSWAERAEKVIMLFQNHELFTLISPVKHLELGCTVLLNCLDRLRESVANESTTQSQDFLIKGDALIMSACLDTITVDSQNALIVEHILDRAKPLMRLFFWCLCLEFLPLDNWTDKRSLLDFKAYSIFSSSELDVEVFATMESHDIFLEITNEYPNGPIMEIRVRQKLRKVREFVAKAFRLPVPKDTGNDFYTAMRKHLIILGKRHRTTSIDQGVSANSQLCLQSGHKTHGDVLDAMRRAVADVSTTKNDKKAQENCLYWTYILEELIAQFYSIKMLEGISARHIQEVSVSIVRDPEQYVNLLSTERRLCRNSNELLDVNSGYNKFNEKIKQEFEEGEV